MIIIIYSSTHLSDLSHHNHHHHHHHIFIHPYINDRSVGKGKGFGEIALTQGDDLRTATVTATSHVECVRLHKSNYDYFVRDIQVID